MDLPRCAPSFSQLMGVAGLPTDTLERSTSLPALIDE
jgi:hypothetical protein